jgi:hypothetical protein
MPLEKLPQAVILRGQHQHTGQVSVTYVNPKRRTSDAILLGPATDNNGTNGHIKISLRAGLRRTIIDNVPPATDMHSTSCYRADRRVSYTYKP